MSAHRHIQIAQLCDWASDEARMYRIRAGKAADLGNRSAAIYFVNRAQKCDSIHGRCMSRLYPA